MTNITHLQHALTNLRTHLAANPTDIDALADLAVMLAQLGQTEQALAVLLPAVQQHPQHLGLQHNLAELYRNIGATDKAEQLFTALIHQQPLFVPAYQSLMLILNTHLSSAQLTDEQRAELLSRLAIISNNMGNALLEAGQMQAAETAYSEALQYWADYPSAHSNLSNVARLVGRISDAESHARKALALRPDFAEAWNNLGTALSEQGRCAEAISCYQRALAVNPNQLEAQHNAGSGSLFLQLYRDDLTSAQVVDAHRQWGESLRFPALPHTIPATDKIRVGFISADFREHSVMYFAEGLLKQLNRQEFDIVCYANQTGEDYVTQRIKAMPLLWRPVAALSDDALCEQIRQDQLHILIDLSGHSKGHRLYALAKKPAPIIALWLGYPFTTGLPAFDYRLTDKWADPEAVAPHQHTEQVVYLQNQFNYRPHPNALPVNALPALHNGYITFGSLNNVQKMNRSVVAVWSEILLRIPNSRLILQNKLLVDAGVAGRIRGLFEAFGVDTQRLEFRPACEYHLKTYNEIDIALDPFPFNGATTTCEALWMGLPVLSLAGDNSVARMGVSILSAVGLEQDWLAHTTEDYIALAQQHTAALDKLAALRTGLRERVANSQLCDDAAFTADFADCLKHMVAQKIGDYK
ncbi:MAG: tetratricopeptide repeat protein [Methylococcales bacterium]|nr:tetratricopeptide repeat protein [Methylococcales bacterium]